MKSLRAKKLANRHEKNMDRILTVKNVGSYTCVGLTYIPVIAMLENWFFGEAFKPVK